jgi:hypothetical protein
MPLGVDPHDVAGANLFPDKLERIDQESFVWLGIGNVSSDIIAIPLASQDSA